MSIDWCRAPDGGLPAPDLLLHLELPTSEAESRGGYGEERYEVPAFQLKVKEQVWVGPPSLRCCFDGPCAITRYPRHYIPGFIFSG